VSLSAADTLSAAEVGHWNRQADGCSCPDTNVITVTAASFALPIRAMAEARFRPTGTTMGSSPIHFSCQYQSTMFRTHTD